MHRGGPILLAVICGSTAALAAPPPQSLAPNSSAETQAAPKPVPIAVAITAIRHEAAASWAKDQTLPRSEPTFALEKRWTVPPEAVVQALCRRLDTNAAIDAYIKFQLLSFAPPIGKAEGEPLRRMIASMPSPAAQPSLDTASLNQRSTQAVGMSFGRQMSYVRGLQTVVAPGVAVSVPQMGVLSSGQSIGTTDDEDAGQQRYQMVKQINAQLGEARKTIAAANGVIYAYRAALVDRLPQDPVLRLNVMYKDLADRLRAGDPDCSAALEKVAEATKAAVQKEQLDDAARRNLVENILTLSQMRAAVTDEVELQGEQIHARGRMLILSRDDLAGLAKLLGADFQQELRKHRGFK